MARSTKHSASVLQDQSPNIPSSQSSQHHGSQKRKADEPDQSPARKVARNTHHGHVTDVPIVISSGDEHDDDDDANDGWNDIVASTQDPRSSQYDDYMQYGIIDTKIVGIRYYDGRATVGEHVLIRREANNQYDSNAIRIDNVRGEQIGHIPRQMAAKLAKYIDNRWLGLEGILAGEKGAFDCPIRLVTYGPTEPQMRSHVKENMVNDKLPVQSLKEIEKKELARRKEQLKKAAKDGARTKKMRGEEPESSQTDFAPSQNDGLGGDAPDVEDFMQASIQFNPREMGELVEKFGTGEDLLAAMPMTDAPSKLATEMLPYQRQGLAWLVDRENPVVPPKGSKDVVQLWRRTATNDFINIATNFSIREEPKLASGGILADDMGLGKTLQIISLICSGTAEDSGPTLIIAPVSVMSNWSGQIAHHVKKDHALRVLTYHGSSRKQMTAEEFQAYDVVITTYGTLTVEYLPKGKDSKAQPVPRPRGLFAPEWRRVVLDEGHTIRNPNSKASRAASMLLAKSRWVLTGTPIINNLKDLYSLVRFIGLTGGLERLELFNSVLIRPIKSGAEDANLLLQALMSTLCLRRRKEMKFIDLELPELKEFKTGVTLLNHEQEKYDALLKEAKGLVSTYEQKRNDRNGGSKAQEAYRHLLEVLLRMRQVCNHWKMCAERIESLMTALEGQKTVDLTPENKRALQDLLQLSIESQDDCPVCLENLNGHEGGPVITTCAHVFGADCINRVIESQHKCPMCRAELPDSSILVKPGNDGEDLKQGIDIDIEEDSSKTLALMNLLGAIGKKKENKVVVFSQWCRFLDIVQHKLDKQGYKYTRIDGTMSATQRDAALNAIENEPDTTILLASLGVCAVGLNLVAANHVILCDSWWAPAIEDQAVDRVHRLGQKRETTVFRLVVEGSIEERTLAIQADKRKLMMDAFQEKSSKRTGGKSARMADIQKLLE